MEVHPLGPALGAEIRGVDLSRELDAAVIGDIITAWEQYSVLLFRDQDISIADQRRFVTFFGDVQEARSLVERKNPEIMYVGNTSVDGQVGEIPHGDMQFHNDQCAHDRPVKGTSLYALEIPSAGGNTMFASTALAYEAIPAALRKKLEDLDVLFVNDYRNNGTKRGVPVWDGAPRHIHPLLIVHPTTGRPLLFCNRLNAESIVGYASDESEELIMQLCEILERREHIYEHVWKVHDIVLWDNLATSHARTDFDPAERRSLRRMAIKGTVPVALRDARINA